MSNLIPTEITLCKRVTSDWILFELFKFAADASGIPVQDRVRRKRKCTLNQPKYIFVDPLSDHSDLDGEEKEFEITPRSRGRSSKQGRIRKISGNSEEPKNRTEGTHPVCKE